MSLLTVVLGAALMLGQTARPVTLVSEVRAALAAHDLARAESIVAKRRAEQGNTAEVLEAASWLGRGALAEKQVARAEQYAADVQKQIVTALAGRPSMSIRSSQLRSAPPSRYRARQQRLAARAAKP